MPLSTFSPGYVQVDAFGPDEGYESDEEVTFVTLDLGCVEPALVPSSSSYRLIGLDTPTPFLQLSGTIFKGQHQSLLGTELLFTDAKDDNQERNKRTLAHVGTTEQRIRFKEVELRERNASSVSQPEQTAETGQSKSKKNRIPETVGEVVGSTIPDPEPPRRRGGRRRRTEPMEGNLENQSKGKGRGKGKGKERETMQPGDVSANGTGEELGAAADGEERVTVDVVEGLQPDIQDSPGENRGVHQQIGSEEVPGHMVIDPDLSGL
ncbi:uncharacterized protein LAESUDRAFT_663015 [Laetiporus sulphureus 93-53]|uniref:Transcription factor TFIIIC triple barrel domain-containing protein n=1 Tax=Laetiporus sulphureus 93-53 TaxID=1314785 RepID=A0A165BY71_9APHY|nr:uncharacterized protein LAESUDRAFT_663015 [Laetiporus sulphureus 93-53]KZT01864.1 hypothetical protein LAESUDRAFT_663015 [Laetiporus sulphureus 93-53]